MSNKAPSIVDLELLTPASRWKRENGRMSTFLMLTNTSIPEKHAKRFPQIAVFADEDGNILSLPLQEFLHNRTYYNIDPALELRLNNLLQDDVDNGAVQRELDADDDLDVDLSLDDDDEEGGGDIDLSLDDDEDDEDAFDIDGATDEEQNLAGQEVFMGTAAEPVVAAAAPVTVKVTAVNVAAAAPVTTLGVSYQSATEGLPVLIDPSLLAQATIGYEQAPVLSQNLVQHTLTIRAVNGVTREALHNSFSPENIETNAVFTVLVQTPDGPIEIDWDQYAGVYDKVDAKYGSVFTVIVYTALNPARIMRVDDEPVQFSANVEDDGTTVISANVELDADSFILDKPQPQPAAAAAAPQVVQQQQQQPVVQAQPAVQPVVQQQQQPAVQKPVVQQQPAENAMQQAFARVAAIEPFVASVEVAAEPVTIVAEPVAAPAAQPLVNAVNNDGFSIG